MDSYFGDRTLGLTGASGMIGRFLAEWFSAEFPACTIRCLTRTIPAHNKPGKLEWMPGDLLSEADCREFVEGLDVVLHFAQANNPASSDRHWPSDHAANGQITLNLLQALRERPAPPAHFIFASSGGAVYGKGRGRPFRENDPCLPLSPYGIQKLAAEHYIRLAVEQGWLTACVLRIANAYGVPLAPERRQGLIGVALQRAADGLPLRLFGSAETVRDYLHLSDLADAVAKCLFYRDGFAIFNIGSGKGFSTGQVLGLVREITGKELPVQPSGYGQRVFDLTPEVILDISLAREKIGWVPKTELRQGIATLWQMCCQNQGAQLSSKRGVPE